MYVPAAFAVDEPEAWAMLAAARLGVLVTPGLQATHLPFVVDPGRRTLTGHVARANPHPAAAAGEALVIFSGVSAYVSPAFYPSKGMHGRVVPTWNYEAVHVRGRLAWFDDRHRLLDTVATLSDRFEAGRTAPWSVADAPADYIERLLGAIVGVEVTALEITGVRKLSQNRNAADREAVLSGLVGGDDEARAVAGRMSAPAPA